MGSFMTGEVEEKNSQGSQGCGSDGEQSKTL